MLPIVRTFVYPCHGVGEAVDSVAVCGNTLVQVVRILADHPAYQC